MANLTPQEVLEAVDGWTLLQINEFVEKFCEKYNVSASAPVAVAAAAGPAAAEAAVEKTEFTVMLTECGADKDQGHQGSPRHQPHPGPERGQGWWSTASPPNWPRTSPRPKPRRSRRRSRPWAARSRSSNVSVHATVRVHAVRGRWPPPSRRRPARPRPFGRGRAAAVPAQSVSGP